MHFEDLAVDLNDADPTYNDSSLRRSLSSSTTTSDREDFVNDAIVFSELLPQNNKVIL